MNYYLIIGTTFLISVIVNIIFRKKFREFSKFNLHSCMSGKEVAEKMLRDNGINDVSVLSVEGELTDHYNPMNKTINLSEIVYHGKDAASVSVAAHECGHVLQHKLGYNFLKLRNELMFILKFSSRFTNFFVMSGLTIFYKSEGKSFFILKLGIILFLVVIAFYLINLPIEFDASYRALNWMRNKNIVNFQEYDKAKESLHWAAMTYMVSALGRIVQLVYFLSFFNDETIIMKHK
ncbi:zinc metallopeptidase [Blattabacterium cuenoti]|uniref:zinc metallopeptidase n=1 Tax=Blattabacterium cuenoti TaxID=1653831 RepID=UPI00163BC639|nr:zinc metallopeptidase [Blattabacterium cuenoti]